MYEGGFVFGGLTVAQNRLPTPLARMAMRVLPPTAMQKAVDAMMRAMRANHPRLFGNLEKLPSAVLRVEPVDLPHRFILSFGGGTVRLTVSDGGEPPCSAAIKGKLEALLELLEGRTDGDMMFFARTIEITGNTATIVALRNTLDREEIDLLTDATGFLGPFAPPARRALLLADTLGRRLRARIVEIQEESAPRNDAACDALRTEIQALKTRLAKLEVQRQRKEASAA